MCRSGNPVCDIDRELLLLLLPHAHTQQPNNISQKYKKKKKKKRRWGDVWPRYILSTVSYLHKRVKLSISLFFLIFIHGREEAKEKKEKKS